MKKEMIKLLLSQNVISEEEAKRLDLINDETIEESIKELGFGKTEHITKDKICETLETEKIGNEILCFRKVFSTNSIAKFLANHDAKEGTVLISEIQTNARGRLGKKWEAPEGGIWMSLILRPQVPPARIGLITLATGVAIAKSIRSLGVDARIKWPNDVLIHGKKIAISSFSSTLAGNSSVKVVVPILMSSEKSSNLRLLSIPIPTTIQSISLKVALTSVNTPDIFLP